MDLILYYLEINCFNGDIKSYQVNARLKHLFAGMLWQFLGLRQLAELFVYETRFRGDIPEVRSKPDQLNC
jgi:hypothetical protein